MPSLEIAVVNLDRSPDRRAHMQAQLDGLGLRYHFFSATDGQRGDLAGINRYDEAGALRKLGRTLTLAEQGCYASHYRIWQQIVERNCSLIVMEDDVSIGPAFAGAMPLIDQQLQRLGFLRLCGTLDPRRFRVELALDQHFLIRFLKGPRGTQCYALTPEGARRLLRCADRWVEAVDEYLDAYWVHHLPSWALVPFHVKDQVEGSLPSLIERVRPPIGMRRKLQRELSKALATLRRICFNLRPPRPD